MSAAATLGRDTGVVHLVWPARPAADGYAGHVAFERRGDPDAPTLVVLGGISADRHLASTPEDPTEGWWEPQVGCGRALDPTRFSLVSLDYLAGPGASAPASMLAAGREAPLTPGRQAEAIAAVLDALGVGRARAIVGASYGGMVALAFAERYPERVERLAVLCAAHEPHPMATALRSLQRKVVRLAADEDRAPDGLALARGLAMTTYRTACEFARRFRGPPRWSADGVRFPVEAYLDARGRAFAGRFDVAAFLALSESLDLHRIDPARIVTPTWLLASRSDLLVPVWQVRALARALSAPVSLTEVRTDFGHDAFLKEPEAVERFLVRALHGPLDRTVSSAEPSGGARDDGIPSHPTGGTR